MAKALNVSLAVTADTSQAKAELQSLQKTLQQLSANSTNLNLGINTSEIQAASSAALQLAAHLKQATDVNTGTLNFTKFESQIRHSGQTIEGLGSQLLSLGPQGQQAFNQLAQAVAKSEIPMKKISGMLGQFGTVISNTIRWQASSSIIHGIMGSIQGAYNYAQDLNKSLNNIQIVTQMSDNQMSNFAESANKAAKALSTTTTSYTDAALIYYQQGIRDQNEINERTSATIKMANVTGQSAEKVSNQMTAIWNNFAKGGDNLEYYADVITALGAATASSSEEISTGLQKFASVADTVGLSYENATAALATITATTRQSADSVGTGLRTLFARLESLKLGETLEDGVNLTKYTKALQTVGVQVLDTNGNLKDMDTILDDLGERWGDISDTQKVALAQTVGGVRQYTTLMALMNNFDFYKENVDIAKNSEGTLQRQQETYEKSWAASSKRVRAAMETIFSTVISDQFFINLNDGFAKFLDIINNVIKGLGGMKGLLLGLGGVLGQVFAPQITQGLYNFSTGIADIFTSGKTTADIRNKTISNLAGMMSGGTYNPDTGIVEGAGKSKTGYEELINNQANFSKNAAFMAPWQRQYAQMVLDNEQKAIEANAEAQKAVTDASITTARSQGSLWRQSRAKAEEEYKNNEPYRRAMEQATRENSDEFGNLTGTPEQIRARANQLVGQIQMSKGDKANFMKEWDKGLTEQLTKYKNQAADKATALSGLENLKNNPELLKKISEGNLTDDEVAKLTTNLGGETFGAELLGQLRKGYDTDTLDNLIADISGRQVGGSVLTTLKNKYGIDIDDQDFADWQNNADTEGAKRAAAAIAQAREDEAHRQGKEAGKPNKELSTAGKITSVATGLMQAAAAGQSLQSVVGVFDQMNSGAISASEGITQLATGLTTTATQGMMAFNSLSTVLGGFGGALATIAMITLPYIIQAFDGMFESDKERSERYAKYTELAQERLTNAKASYQELLSGFDTHDSLLDELSKLTKGTAEFEEALSNANAEAENLIDKYDLSQAAGDYYYDQNGAIQFSKKTQEHLEADAKKEIAEAETGVLQAQYTEALNTYQTNQKILDNMSAQYNRNSQLQNQGAGKTDQAFFAQYNDLAKSLGYTSGQQLYDLYTGGQAAEVQKQNYFKSGVKKAYSALNKNKALADDGVISDIETLQNAYLESQQAAHLDEANRLAPSRKVIIDEMPEGWSNEIDLANTSWTQSLTFFEKAYEAIAGPDKLAALQNDLSYQNKSKKDKKIALAALIQNADQEKKLAELEQKYQVKWDEAKLKEFDGYKKKKGAASVKLGKAYDQAMKNLSDGTGTNADLTTLIMTQQVIQAQAESLSNLAGVINSSTLANFNQDEFIDGLRTGIYSIEDIDTLTNYTAQFASNFGEASATSIFTSLKDSLASNSSDFIDILDEIDFSGSGITALFDINKQLKNSAKLTPDTKNKLIKLRDDITTDIGGKDGLFNELINSAEFSDTFTNLTKNVKDFGDISAKSIMDAADSCDILSNFLDVIGETADDAEINAQGLASALELISLGEIDASQVSAGLLAALSAAGQLDNQLASVYKHIDDYESERSAADIGSFYQAREKDINTSLGAGIFADKPLLQSWQEIFGDGGKGTGGVGDYMDWAIRTSGMSVEDRQKDYNTYFADEIKAMNSIYERGNLSGMYEYALNRTQGESWDINGTNVSNNKGQIMAGDQKLMHYDAKSQQLVIDNMKEFQGMFTSMDDFAGFLESNLGMSHDMAQSMAAEVGQYNAEVQQYFKEQDINAGQQALMDASKNGTLTRDQIEAFKKEYSAFSKEMQSDDWVDNFIKACQDAGGSVIDMGDDFDYASTNYDTLQDALGGEEGLQNYLQSKGARTTTPDNEDGSIGNKKVTDLKNLQQALQDLGYSADQANAFIDANAESFGALAFQVRDAESGIIKSMDTEDAEFQSWYQSHKDGYENMAQAVAAYQDEQAELAAAKVQADAIADALGMENFGTTMEQLSGVISSLQQALAGLGEGETEVDFTTGGTEQNVISAVKTINENLASIEREIVITYTSKDETTQPATAHPASGMNNAVGFAGGNHINNDFQGIAETGELGPELWIHDGEPALTGVHGRNKIFVSKGDQIFTAAQTREILRKNPQLQNIPGYAGSNTYGHGIDSRGGNGGSGGGSDGNNNKSDDYDPERYHEVTRAITRLTEVYERLAKVRENAYGTNILDALDKEIEAQDKLIAKQKELIAETEKYEAADLKTLDKLGVKYTLDENGEISNWDELQKKYEKKANKDKDSKEAEIWDAIKQYEETIDKKNEAKDKLQEMIYKEMELKLKKITVKSELQIKFDDKQIELLKYQINKIDDNIYKTGEALALVEQSMGRIVDKMDATKTSINEIFKNMHDENGNAIEMTLEKFLAMTDAERDALHINGAFGEELEKQIENLQKYTEELEKYKTKGVDELSTAFKELSSSISNYMDLFNYYNRTLTIMKDIVDLQNIKFPKALRDSVNNISDALATVNENNIQAEKDYYKELSNQADAVRAHLAETTDFDLQKKYQAQLSELEKNMRTSMENIATLWQTGLQQAQEDFSRTLDYIVEDYESSLAGIYDDLDSFSEAFKREQEVHERYVEDYEKYYQLSKLQRTINKDLDKAAVNGYKNNAKLSGLLEEINNLQESGQAVNKYDLELLQKRYEYFKALTDLEDARDAKSQVRLQRDKNGNWSYVYTANEEELENLQQAADDKLYELQKFIRESSDDIEEQINDLAANYIKNRTQMLQNGASAEALAEFDKYYEEQLAYLGEQQKKMLDDANSTVGDAQFRYKQDSFDIIDTFGETINGQITAAESTDALISTITDSMNAAATSMTNIVAAYADTVERLNQLVGGDGDFATNLNSFVDSISQSSQINLGLTEDAISDFKKTFSTILEEAKKFEKAFMEIYAPIIAQNQELVQQLTDALEGMNRTDSENENTGTDSDDDKDDNKDDNKEEEKEKVSYSGWKYDKTYHWKIKTTKKGKTTKKEEVKKAKHSWKYGQNKSYKYRKCRTCSYTDYYAKVEQKKQDPPTGGCFAPDTLILMADYTLKYIEEIKVNEFVIAYNELTAAFEPKKVTKSYVHYNTPSMIRLYFENNFILDLTPGHPLLSAIDGWKSLDTQNSLYEHGTITTLLNLNDEIINISGNSKVVGIEKLQIDDNYNSYNIEVETCHTFLANGFVVHNRKIDPHVGPDGQTTFDTGGYTGNWGSTEGKLAILHEKEQVFNKDDTAKLLMASKILQTIDVQARYASGVYNHLSSPSIGSSEQVIQQEVKIEAQFPNATNHSEIEQAFNNLSNKAIQYANRKNK